MDDVEPRRDSSMFVGPLANIISPDFRSVILYCSDSYIKEVIENGDF